MNSDAAAGIVQSGVCQKRGGRKRDTVLVCMALIVIILAVYAQVGNHEFLTYDDNSYVTENPRVASGITGPNIIWAFTSIDEANWHPITWLSHMADVQVYGMNPRGHHLTNVVIHTVSSLLLLLLLLRITGSLWQSSFVAALFALHPLHVESVAWVAERKDVLSALFWFLTLLFYSEYVVKRKPALYLLSLFSFVLGLMSKPMLVTLPIVMLLIDFWPLYRYRLEEPGHGPGKLSDRVIALVKEKIPFLACSLFSGVITIYAQGKGGAISGTSFWFSIENAPVAYVRYIGKTLWPRDLAVLYLISLSALPLWQVIGSLLVLVLFSGAAIWAGRRYPYLAVGWFWFLVTLLPVIGLIQVGSQSMADRYTYLPLIGLFIMIAWGVPELTKGLQHREGILSLLAGVVITATSALTWQQLGYWQDSVTLYRHTIQVTTGNFIIHNSLGTALAGKGDPDAAILEYREALRIYPNYKEAHYNLGFALAGKGDLDAAIQEYQVALGISPDDIDALNNLGVALARKGDLDTAIRQYRVALRLSPDNKDTHNNLGVALFTKGDLDAAIHEFQYVLRISPDDTNVQDNLRTALYSKRMKE